MRSNSTTTKSRTTNTYRRRHPISFYRTAQELREAVEGESLGMQNILFSRLVAMAEYLLTTPAQGVLAERMYIALGDAWQHNRDTHNDDRIPARISVESRNPWDDVTVDLHHAILRALEFSIGNADDEGLAEELRQFKPPAMMLEEKLEYLTRQWDSCASKNFHKRALVVDLAKWKESHAGRTSAG